MREDLFNIEWMVKAIASLRSVKNLYIPIPHDVLILEIFEFYYENHKEDKFAIERLKCLARWLNLERSISYLEFTNESELQRSSVINSSKVQNLTEGELRLLEQICCLTLTSYLPELYSSVLIEISEYFYNHHKNNKYAIMRLNSVIGFLSDECLIPEVEFVDTSKKNILFVDVNNIVISYQKKYGIKGFTVLKKLMDSYPASEYDSFWFASKNFESCIKIVPELKGEREWIFEENKKYDKKNQECYNDADSILIAKGVEFIIKNSSRINELYIASGDKDMIHMIRIAKTHNIPVKIITLDSSTISNDLVCEVDEVSYLYKKGDDE